MLVALLLLFSTAVIGPPAFHSGTGSLNVIVGDMGFIRAYGREPTAADSDDMRIRAHLDAVVELLRQDNIGSSADDETIQRRHTLLNALEAYAAARVFPRNEYTTTRSPVFIDSRGVPCAVAYLIAVSVGWDAARAVSLRHQHQLILEMDDPWLDAWALRHGFSLVELATIQPAYGGWEPNEKTWRMPTKLSAAVVRNTLKGRFEGCSRTPLNPGKRVILMAHFTIWHDGLVLSVRIDDAGDATAETQKCVVESIKRTTFATFSEPIMLVSVPVVLP